MAVALDTSGSCCGEVMQGFLRELLSILRDAGGPGVEMTVIQCDTQIQKIQTLKREDTPEGVLETFSILGCGGTDFRPVFDYVSAQRQDAEGKRFRGLLYLSDGCGEFPDQAPDYPVAFLYPKGENMWGMGWYDLLPEWVMKVRITEDDRLVIQDGDVQR